MSNYFGGIELSDLYQHISEKVKEKIIFTTQNFERIGPINLPCKVGPSVTEILIYFYKFKESGDEYFIITRNASLTFENPFIRISSNCFYGFVLNSMRCDCKWQFDTSLELLQNQPENDFLIIFAVNDHGKAIRGGLKGHVLLYALGQEQKQELIKDAYTLNGFEQDERNYLDIDILLKSLAIKNMRLLTNNPDRITFFKEKGYKVEHFSLEMPYDKYLSEELGMKKRKLGHILDLPGFKEDDIRIYGLNPDEFDI